MENVRREGLGEFETHHEELNLLRPDDALGSRLVDIMLTHGTGLRRSNQFSGEREMAGVSAFGIMSVGEVRSLNQAVALASDSSNKCMHEGMCT
jgi:hypothetical protein